MYKKYDCLNNDGSYDAYNSCYLHNDNKGFNFYMLNDKDYGVTNELENTVYHSENDNDYSYEERKNPSFKEITEIIYKNYWTVRAVCGLIMIQ